MPWICKTPGCEETTYRRPPDNACSSCRSTRRGINRSKAKAKKKLASSARGLGKDKRLQIEHGVATVSVTPTPTAEQRPGSEPSQKSLQPSDSLRPGEAGGAKQPGPLNLISDLSTLRSTVPATSSSIAGLGPCDYWAVKMSLEGFFRTSLVKIFGHAKAHTICGKAHDIIAQFQQLKKPMPLERTNSAAGVQALISVAAAICREEMDMELWNRHCRLGKTMGVLQLRWMINLPFARELAFVEGYNPAVRCPDLPGIVATQL